MYLLMNESNHEVTAAKSFFDLKSHVIYYLYEFKKENELTPDLEKVYEEVVKRLYDAEDEEEVRKCIVTSNVYFNQRVKLL